MSSQSALLPSPSGRGAGGEGRAVKVPLPAGLKTFARELRGSQTDAESAMWYLLRDRRFFGLKFRRQHPVQPYVLDFFCQELSLAVELDGGQHNEGNNVKRDKTRSAELARRGIQVARYWNDEVLKQTESVLEDLMLRVQQLGLSLTPDPSPEGRGGARQ